jgi:hypothetical protein
MSALPDEDRRRMLAGHRRHTREETPFFTGLRVPVEQLVAALP